MITVQAMQKNPLLMQSQETGTSPVYFSVPTLEWWIQQRYKLHSIVIYLQFSAPKFVRSIVVVICANFRMLKYSTAW